MQDPFKPSHWAKLLDSPYPVHAFDAKTIATRPTRKDVSQFVNLWMTEGIPYAFRYEPMRYELIREWIGNYLDVQPKNISLVGSARIGFSLSPDKFGREYEPAVSDIDLFVVSQNVFYSLRADFDQWLDDWWNGYLDEKKWGARFWDENVKVVTNTLKRGFIDTNKIPPLPQCKMSLKCAMLIRNLRQSLKLDDRIPNKCSIRVYKNWDSALKQNIFNLETNLHKIGFLN
ncbi:MAG TPA: hypothetical protein VGA60_08920 [Kiloniellales bacterium]|jgi:hypothetical protein